MLCLKQMKIEIYLTFNRKENPVYQKNSAKRLILLNLKKITLKKNLRLFIFIHDEFT